MTDHIAQALAHARQLDAMLAAGVDEDQEERLLAIGDLAGGLSTHGFEFDLQAHLDGLEADLLDEAPSLPWRHPSDPDMSPREAELHAGIFDAQAEFARGWLVKARELEREREAA